MITGLYFSIQFPKIQWVYVQNFVTLKRVISSILSIFYRIIESSKCLLLITKSIISANEHSFKDKHITLKTTLGYKITSCNPTFKFKKKIRTTWLEKIYNREQRKEAAAKIETERRRGLFHFTKLQATRPPFSYLSIIVIIGRLANEEARVVVIAGPFPRR